MQRFFTLLFSCLLLSSFSFAQSQTPKPFLIIGPEVGLTTRNPRILGVGGSIKLGVPVNDKGAFTFTTGFNHFYGKGYPRYWDHRGNQMVIPARLGFKYNVYKNFYLEPQVGYSRLLFGRRSASLAGVGMFSHAIVAGVAVSNRWDISAKYEGNEGKYVLLNSVGLTFGYKLNRKK